VLGLGPSAAFFGHSGSTAWLNGDVGYEFRSSGGFSLLIAGGFYKGLAGRVPSLSFNPDVPDDPATSEFGPQLRAAAGWWF
jgi:hypothetical protein